MSYGIFSERKNMYSVMKNQGFGDVTILNNGLGFVVPQSLLTKSGLIREDVMNLIKGIDSNILNLKNIRALKKLGVEFFKYQNNQ